MIQRFLLTLAFCLFVPLATMAQRPVFHTTRPFLDNLTEQFGGEKMDPGEMDENDAAVLSYMRKVKVMSPSVEGFTQFSGVIKTGKVHLHWDADEEMEEDALDMNVSGRWNYDIEWPSDDIDPHLLLRRWINNTIRTQIEDTFGGDCKVVPYPGGSKEFQPMMDYYAGKYRKLYREQTLATREENEWEGAFRQLYQVEFNPTLVIWLRCLNAKYATFYVADFRPSYRSGPEYRMHTINRYNGKEVWLEDIVSAERIDYIKKTIRDRYAPFESDGNLDGVIRDHEYCLALTESGIVLSFKRYTFSITAGSEAFQVFFKYQDIL